jgi:hypothetical protein
MTTGTTLCPFTGRHFRHYLRSRGFYRFYRKYCSCRIGKVPFILPRSVEKKSTNVPKFRPAFCSSNQDTIVSTGMRPFLARSYVRAMTDEVARDCNGVTPVTG